jgi:competence ComEA-like helix-hairpin-helix protein
MTMTNRFNAPSELWGLPPLELTLWFGLLVSVGLWSLSGRGRNQELAGVQVYDVAAAKDRSAASVYRLDVNSATEAELVLLPGIGPRRAAAIVKERQKRGAFNTVWELTEVPGLTQALVRRLEPMLRAVPPPKLPHPNPQN